jgi:hypothetical protein
MRECPFCRKQVPSHLRVCPDCGNVPVNVSVHGTLESYPQMPLSYYRTPAPVAMPQPETPRHTALSRGTMTLLVSLALLIMLGGFGLILYAGVLRPAQLRVQATAMVQSVQTVNAYVTATAQVQATAFAVATVTIQRQVQATATALQNLYVQSTSGTPLLDETLATQTSVNWDVYNAVGGGGCAFSGGVLLASVAQPHFYVPCFAHATNFSNFAYEAQISIIKGDEAGLIFRANDANSEFYVFRIGRDGNYALYISKDAKNSVPIAEDSSPAIKTGPGQVNTLAVIAQGSNIYMYINKQFAASVNDGTYAAGEIGVFAGDNTNATEVAFSNVRVFSVPSSGSR